MVKRPTVVAQHEFPGQTLAQFNQTKQAQAQLGFGPTIISATGPSNAPLFASVFEPASNLPFSDPAMLAADFVSRNTSATPNSILTWAAVYGDPGNERFAGIWHLNPAKTIWNADGIAETLAVSQQRFNAQTASFARLRFMTSSRGQRFLSIYSDDQIGSPSPGRQPHQRRVPGSLQHPDRRRLLSAPRPGRRRRRSRALQRHLHQAGNYPPARSGRYLRRLYCRTRNRRGHAGDYAGFERPRSLACYHQVAPRLAPPPPTPTPAGGIHADGNPHLLPPRQPQQGPSPRRRSRPHRANSISLGQSIQSILHLKPPLTSL